MSVPLHLSRPIIDELGLPETHPLAAALEVNLIAIYNNCRVKDVNVPQWDALTKHLCWPEEYPCPPDMGLMPVPEMLAYGLALQHIETLYDYT